MEWALEELNGLRNEIIIKSFKECGSTLAMDGSEEGKFMVSKRFTFIDSYSFIKTGNGAVMCQTTFH